MFLGSQGKELKHLALKLKLASGDYLSLLPVLLRVVVLDFNFLSVFPMQELCFPSSVLIRELRRGLREHLLVKTHVFKVFQKASPFVGIYASDELLGVLICVSVEDLVGFEGLFGGQGNGLLLF